MLFDGVMVSRGRALWSSYFDMQQVEVMKGPQALFFGKATCATCHPAPYYTDNNMHNLQTERFFKSHMVNGMMSYGDGPIKTFPLREAAKALGVLAGRASYGKVVLIP